MSFTISVHHHILVVCLHSLNKIFIMVHILLVMRCEMYHSFFLVIVLYVSTPVFNILLMCAACEREGDRRTEQGVG